LRSVKPFIARFSGDSNISNALAVEILSYSQSSSHEKDVVARLLPLVLDVAASQFELQKYSSASKRSPLLADYPYSSWPSCCEGKGQRDAGIVVGLYQHLLLSDGKKASNLLSKIQLQTESLPHAELDRLIIPLLEQMMHVVDLHSPEACKFFQSMMETYIMRVVQKEPEKPRDWSRPNECKICFSFCSDCVLLREFLMDPREERRRFVVSSEHLRFNVPSQCEISAYDRENPTVFIVTKTLRGWEENHLEWKNRASKAQETFKRLPQIELKQCLAEKYDKIIGLDMVKLQDEDSIAQAIDAREEINENHSHKRSQSTEPQEQTRIESDEPQSGENPKRTRTD
jgi:hypothetical protein